MLPAIPKPIPMPFAQNGERRAIPETNTTPGSADASWATGFPPVTRINKQAGGKPPYGLDFQGIFHTICEHLFFAQSGNTVPWVGASDGQPGLNYFKGAIVQGSDGGIYMALKPSGPDAPNPDGGGMVGPVDPVGDESGHWINLNLLYGGMPNSEAWITASGTWTAPVDGLYDLLIINGGNGARGTTIGQALSIRGGSSGLCIRRLMWLEAGQEVPVTIGSGGIGAFAEGGYPPYAQIVGGVTSFNGESPESGDPRAFRVLGGMQVSPTTPGIVPAAPGGGYSSTNEEAEGFDGIGYGAGGSVSATSAEQYVGNGKQGAVRARWHDPARAGGPAPEPALFSARRSAPRAAATPVTVNLYNHETGQGSVWREEDAEAKLAEGLVAEEAWLEIRSAKAAEERAAWLANPDTEAERFAMLRVARGAKLAATDYLVAPDYPLTDEQRAAVTAYRQALRDLPAQEGAPWDGGYKLTPWPEAPTVAKTEGTSEESEQTEEPEV